MWKDNDKYKIILASQSPRRKELLAALDIPFEQRLIPDIAETYPEGINPKDVPLHISKLKALSYKDALEENEILITSDTVVIIDEFILGKPKDKDDAFDMLSKLSGRSHEVVTAVCILNGDKEITFSDTTKVYFNNLTSEDICYYLDNYKPYDKAGAYGIQEWIGLRAIRKIEGSFYNVMGLPIDKLAEHLDFILSV